MMSAPALLARHARLVFAVPLLWALAGGESLAAPLAAGAPVVETSRRPDVAVITYREVQGEIGGSDRGPVLQIFGDGRMVTHYPSYMTRAGDYEQRLTPDELAGVLRSLGAKGVLEFDAAAARGATRAAAAAARQRAQAGAAPVTVFEAVDAATTVIEVAVERYQAASPGARAALNETRRAVWTGLSHAAAHHPEVAALRDLAAAEQELRALRERPGFTRIR